MQPFDETEFSGGSPADIWEGWDGVDDRVDDEDEETEVGIDDIEGEANIPEHETPQYLKDEGR